MNKRLRKKKRLGEFTQYGFEVAGTFTCPSADDMDSYVDRVVELAESIGLDLGGGFDLGKFNFYVTAHNKSCTESDRDALRKCLLGLSRTNALHVGPLIDAWRG